MHHVQLCSAAALLALLALLPAHVRGYPSYYASTSIAGVKPGDAFGNMGIANYEAASSDACKVAHNIPPAGFTAGQAYTFTITTNAAYKTGLGMVWDVGGTKGNSGGSGAAGLLAKSHEIAWTAAGDSVEVHAICGAGGSYDKVHVAEAVAVNAAPSPQGDAAVPATTTQARAATTPPPPPPTTTAEDGAGAQTSSEGPKKMSVTLVAALVGGLTVLLAIPLAYLFFQQHEYGGAADYGQNPFGNQAACQGKHAARPRVETMGGTQYEASNWGGV